MWDIMLVNAVVITMDEERRIIPDGAVGVEKNRIVFVGTSEEAKKYRQER